VGVAVGARVAFAVAVESAGTAVLVGVTGVAEGLGVLTTRVGDEGERVIVGSGGAVGINRSATVAVDGEVGPVHSDSKIRPLIAVSRSPTPRTNVPQLRTLTGSFSAEPRHQQRPAQDQ